MIVLDTSAVLTFLYAEPGHDVVQPALENGLICTVNWAETQQKIAFHGGDPERLGHMLNALGVVLEPLTSTDAALAARLYPVTSPAGLSLGDRCCLALALRRGLPVLTADRAWSGLDLDVEVRQVR